MFIVFASLLKAQQNLLIILQFESLLLI